MDGKGKVVCVTGASGFIASWLVKLLLARGYTVHAAVRSLVPTTSAYARGRTPNFQKLKFAAGSDEADDCLHAAFSQDYTENDQLLMVLGEQRDQLSAKVKWLEDLVEEGEGLLPLHKEGHIGLDRLKETLKRERKVLAGLTKAMDLARKGREEKKINLFWFG